MRTILIVATLLACAAFPHFRECERCMHCVIGVDEPSLLPEFLIEMCNICTGCTHTLKNFSVIHEIEGYTFKMHPGSTKSAFSEVSDNIGKPFLLKLHKDGGNFAHHVAVPRFLALSQAMTNSMPRRSERNF